jgi:ornithine carbamoyltransferase
MSMAARNPGSAPGVKLRHYLSVADFSPRRTLEVIATARKLKRAHAHGENAPLLAGRTLAMVFQKPSLRTRVSFEAGMTQLGGHAIYLGPDDIRLGQRESVEDIAIVLARMSDLIMARVFEHAIVEELARHSTVPVINGLSDLEHPCQILADLMTIQERKNRLEGLHVVFVGDGNNVAHSLLLACAALGTHCSVACPPGYEPQPAVLERARACAHPATRIAVTHDVDAACRDADVLYTDVWTSMGQEAEAQARREAFHDYQVNAGLLKLAHPDCTILHCLPAHYGEEIDYAVSRSPNSAIFDQAENRLHAQKALMVMLAG